MAQNIFSGSEGIVYVGSKAVASIRSFSFEETQETIDATTMNTSGVAFRTNKATFKSWSGSVDVYWTTEDVSVDGYGADAKATHVEASNDWTTTPPTLDNVSATSDAALFGILQPGSDEVTLHFWPAGDAVDGYLGYKANCIITGRTISSSVDGMVEASITVLGTAPIETQVKGWTGLTGA
jgi:hypothetical protein